MKSKKLKVKSQRQIKQIDFRAHAQKRLQLIEQLECGQLDKATFIAANLALYDGLTITMPVAIEALEVGLFYYQYYNSLAKYQQLKFRELAEDDLFSALDWRRLSTANYQNKERVTAMLLEGVVNQPIVAYYVKVNSQKLRHKLVEIVFTAQQRVILHTVDDSVIAILRRKNYLTGKTANSLIADYINQPYYDI